MENTCVSCVQLTIAGGSRWRRCRRRCAQVTIADAIASAGHAGSGTATATAAVTIAKCTASDSISSQQQSPRAPRTQPFKLGELGRPIQGVIQRSPAALWSLAGCLPVSQEELLDSMYTDDGADIL